MQSNIYHHPTNSRFSTRPQMCLVIASVSFFSWCERSFIIIRILIISLLTLLDLNITWIVIVNCSETSLLNNYCHLNNVHRASSVFIFNLILKIRNFGSEKNFGETLRNSSKLSEANKYFITSRKLLMMIRNYPNYNYITRNIKKKIEIRKQERKSFKRKGGESFLSSLPLTSHLLLFLLVINYVFTKRS